MMVKFIKNFFKKNNKAIQILLVLIIVFNLSSAIIKQPKYFVFDYWERFSFLKERYFDSQYATKTPTQGFISDALAYSYAGGALITGTNPILVIPEAPPLGKYLIGISALFFNNELIMTAIFAVFSLVGLYMLSMQIFNNKTLALLPSVFWSSEPLFKDQIINGPLFDIYQLVFLLFSLYFFNKGFIKSDKYLKNFAISFLFLGFFISTKFFVSGVIMMTATLVLMFIKRDYKKLFSYILLAPISILVLLSTYVRVFSFGYGVREYLGIQKWIFLYHQSQFILPFSIWPLLYLNKWYVWFGDKPVIQDVNWSFTWPIITTISLVAVVFYASKKVKENLSIEILLFWTIFFLLFFSAGLIFSRYLIILLPIMYVISVYFIKEIIKTYYLNPKS